MASYEREPVSVILDIDDTCDVVHGHQQLSLFNAHYDERCFLPIHVYDTEKKPPCGGCIAARQDAVGRRGSRPSAPPRPAHSPELEEDAHHVSGRWPLRAARGDGVVRGQWRRLSEKRQLNAEPRNFEAAVQPIVGFAGQAGAIRRGGGRSWRPPSQDRTAWARIRRQR